MPRVGEMKAILVNKEKEVEDEVALSLYADGVEEPSEGVNWGEGVRAAKGGTNCGEGVIR